ncbi:hypothetical protein HPB52_023404 [Rhipicephalus sanguineus]|uniref:Uncharacterized protein n=1 Tax=Rhipicephalus sanguineus TaxID=34632 RepID=A0A9D4PFL5_RHISA|nr:hypothetical protein HPB52_023404 [Rhipicephalus sanguineus]
MSTNEMLEETCTDPPRYRTAYACEGSQLRISCDEGHLVQLIRANYGRFSISICNEHGTLDWSVDCMSPRSFRVMQQSPGDLLPPTLGSEQQADRVVPRTPPPLPAVYQRPADLSTTTALR